MAERLQLQEGDTIVDKYGNIVIQQPPPGQTLLLGFPMERYRQLDPQGVADQIVHFTQVRQAYRDGEELPEGAVIIPSLRDPMALTSLEELTRKILPLFTNHPE